MKRPTYDSTGLAALSVCESLLIALTEKGVLTTIEAEDVLLDAANAHRTAAANEEDGRVHQSAADLIEFIIKNANSVLGVSKL